VADYNCTVQIEKPDSALTVGQAFGIACDGDWSHFSGDQAELRVDQADKYKIKLLSFEGTSSGAHLTVTSYQAGNQDLKMVQIVNAQESRVLGNLHFQIKSVLDPKTKPEPYGPYGPLRLSLPGWYFIVLALFLVAVVTTITIRVRRHLQKRNMIRELEAQGLAATPFSQFNQNMRRLRREAAFLEGREEGSENEKSAFVQDLEKSYRLYLGRTFLIPTLNWADALVLKDLKRHHKPVFVLVGSEVDRLLQEFSRAKASAKNVKNQDLLQLFELARKNVDAMEVHLKNNLKNNLKNKENT
jgi:hypothetical protein